MFFNILLVGFFLCINYVPSLGNMEAPSFLRPQNRIIGGMQRNIKDIQYQISLWNGTAHFCGAALISPKWAVTAAHCLEKFPNSYVRVNSSDSTTGGQLVKIIKEHIHPLYDEIVYDYDFGILELDSFNSAGLKFAHFRKCHQKKCGAGDVIEVSGWGVNNITDINKSTKLQSVRLQIVDEKECYDTFKSTFDVTDRMICAGHKSGGKDACQGDSGGPVTCKGDLIAVVSAGFACAMANTPGLYTNLSDDDIRNWIELITGIPDTCHLPPPIITTTNNFVDNLLSTVTNITKIIL